MLGIEGERTVIGADRILMAAHSAQCDARVVVRLDCVEAEVDRGGVAGEGFVVAILVAANVAEVLVRLDEVRVKPNRFAECRFGRGEALALGLDDPQAVVTAGVRRVQCQSLAETRLRPRRTARPPPVRCREVGADEQPAARA